MKVWTINYTSYQDAFELKNGEHGLVSPLAVFVSKELAVDRVLSIMNSYRKDYMLDCDECDKHFFKPLFKTDLIWVTDDNKTLWTSDDVSDGEFYVITKLELEVR